MLDDEGYALDLEAASENVEEAEVVMLCFPLLQRTLIVDTRAGASAGAWVGLAPMARSPAERLESLARMRPRLPQPRSITAIPWPRRVASLEASAPWERLLARLGAAGGGRPLARARACLAALHALERAEHAAAIRGDDYDTLWPGGG